MTKSRSVASKVYGKGLGVVNASGTEVDVAGDDGALYQKGVKLDYNGAQLNAAILSKRVRVTAAQVNAGRTILAAVAGKKYRMVDCILIGIGGTAAGATGVQLKCDTVVLIDAKVAAIDQSIVARPGDTNVNVLADGASFVVQAANKAITLIKDGSNLTGATHVDVLLQYVIEK